MTTVVCGACLAAVNVSIRVVIDINCRYVCDLQDMSVRIVNTCINVGSAD